MRFDQEEMLFWLLCLPFVGFILWLGRRAFVHRARRLADAVPAQRLLLSFSDRKSLLSSFFILGALVFLIFALTRPQVGGNSTLVKKEGIDLLFVLDVSKSMLARDIRPDRLRRAKLELESLIDELKGDRVGLIAFAGTSFIQCPMTTDYAAAKLFLKSVSPEDIPVQGTAIGQALDQAHTLLTSSKDKAKSRLVVLLTDGEDHGEKVKEALAKLTKEKIQVVAVGIGSASGEPIPETDDSGANLGYKKGKDGRTVMSRLNEQLLVSIARSTGGRYLSLQAGGSLIELKEMISRMQRTEFEASLYTQYDELYRWGLIPALLLLWFGALLDRRRGSRVLGIGKPQWKGGVR